jgi:predicted Fe-Mo cluster-binding NifX family protein
MRIALPSETPGGLDAALSAHFGHCAVFTIVDVDGDDMKVATIPNGGHEQGGCMAPVMLLKEEGVEVMVAGGMGQRPLMGFQQVGIDVFFNEGVTTVEEAVKLVVAGQARRFGPAQVCGGGPGGDHDHDHGGGGCGGH